MQSGKGLSGPNGQSADVDKMLERVKQLIDTLLGVDDRIAKIERLSEEAKFAREENRRAVDGLQQMVNQMRTRTEGGE